MKGVNTEELPDEVYTLMVGEFAFCRVTGALPLRCCVVVDKRADNGRGCRAGDGEGVERHSMSIAVAGGSLFQLYHNDGQRNPSRPIHCRGSD